MTPSHDFFKDEALPFKQERSLPRPHTLSSHLNGRPIYFLAGQVNFRSCITTEAAEVVLAKSETLQKQVVSHMSSQPEISAREPPFA